MIRRKHKKNFFLPIPYIPGKIKRNFFIQRPYFAFFILNSITLIILYISRDLLYISIIPIFYYFTINKKLPEVFLRENGFEILDHNRIIYSGIYKDFCLLIDEDPALRSYSKAYRYKLLLRKKSYPFQIYTLYPCILSPENLRDIVEHIQDSIQEPMPVIFSMEKLAHDYEHARDIKAGDER